MIITNEQFALNLKVLKAKIPVKPEKFTSEYPKTLEECLVFYCNQRTLHLLQINTILLNQDNWPLPLWFNPDKFKFGFTNRLYILSSKTQRKSLSKNKGFTYVSYILNNRLFYGLKLQEIIIEAFEANIKYAFARLENNPLLIEKKNLLYSIIKSYKCKNWIACITTILPLMDFIARRILRTNNLKYDIKKICQLFEKNGFSIDNAEDLMPFMNSIITRKEDIPDFISNPEKWEKLKDFDFGIIGCALSSFIRFANLYYSYFKEDTFQNNLTVLNRHAILHGSSTNFGTQENTIKLLSFLILVVELEKIFEILLLE